MASTFSFPFYDVKMGWGAWRSPHPTPINDCLSIGRE